MFHYSSSHPRNTVVHSPHHTSYSRVRAVHNVAKGPKVNVVVDGKIALSDVPYKAISDYLRLPSGQHAVAITTADGVTTLASLRTNLSAGKDYTIIAHGDVTNLSSIALLALQDNNSCHHANKAHVRFVHAAATVPAVDIWANSRIKVFSNVRYGETGNPVYLPVDAGKINLIVTPAGSSQGVLGPIPLRLEAGKVYTIVASGLLGDSSAPISALVSEDSSCITIHHHHRSFF